MYKYTDDKKLIGNLKTFTRQEVCEYILKHHMEYEIMDYMTYPSIKKIYSGDVSIEYMKELVVSACIKYAEKNEIFTKV